MVVACMEAVFGRDGRSALDMIMPAQRRRKIIARLLTTSGCMCAGRRAVAPAAEGRKISLQKRMRRGEQAREKCSRVAAQNWCGVSKFTSTASAHAALALHGVARASHPLAVRCSAVTTL